MNPRAIVLSLLLALTPVVGLADTVISVNIAGGNENAPGTGVPAPAGQGIVTGTAGIGQLGNWSNAIGTSGTIPSVPNSEGIATGATVTWSTNNTWSTSTADGAGTDADMMSGYLDNFHANGSIVVEGLGSEFTSAGYEVLVYYQNDNNANTAGFTATDNLANTDTRFGHQLTANNNFPLAGGVDGYIISEETDSATTFSANVVRLTGLRGSNFTLTGVSGTGQPSTRSRPNAIQIISEGDIVDTDGDGLPDDWEILHDLDPEDNGDVDPVNGADGDPDADDLSNIDEFVRGTDPRDPDSDDDTLIDSVENNTGMYVSPMQTGTNPLNPDSDGDTLRDDAEIEENPFFSDPNNPDTDGDGLDDASEQAANPFVTNPSSADTDGDGFSDRVEIGLGSDPTDINDVPNVTGAGGSTISVNIAGGNENAPGVGGAAGEGIVTGIAGIGRLGNWNNAIGTGGTISNAVNADGSATSASVTWVTNNTWSTGTADGLGSDADMMSGYLDNFHANGSIVVSGLGSEFTSAGYEVLVYYQNDNNVNTAGFTATDNLANTDTRFGHQITANNNYPLAGGLDGYIISEETDSATTFSANIVRLTGLTGPDFTLTGVPGTGQPSIRARPNAIQVIGTGPAVRMVITAIDYDPATNLVTLTWNSRPDAIYAVDVSTDLTGWPGDIDDSVVSQGESTTLEFDGPTNGATRAFYRVRESN